MNTLVKIISDDQGQIRESHLQNWHFVIKDSGSNQTLCSGEYFGEGESSCEYELKTVKKGGVTCSDCLKKIKYIKSIKL